ncbi:thaumatin family protein [Legionella sainthelensi]|uniref:thaumatin family protein n=1 Tax=Legionella sainthelensi TaxID=28087 RepID=UPI00135C435F|nr:thaumatin family protein [Legionella sainthelensi]
MMNHLRCGITFVLLVFLLPVYASIDPVAWSLSPETGFPTVQSGETAEVGYTLKNNLPGAVTLITKFAQNGGPFVIQDNCNNRSIPPKGTCFIRVLFEPTAAGQSSIQLTYGYNNNRIPLPTLSAKSSGTPGTGQITGVISNLPASFSLSNPKQTPTFTVTYTNVGTTNVTGFAGNASGNSFFTLNPPNSVATVSAPENNSCGTASAPITLLPGQYCTLNGTLTPVAVGSLTVSGLFTYNSGASTATPSANSQVVNGSGGNCVQPVTGCISVSGTTSCQLQLPASTYQYTDNVVQFVFQNTCSSQSATVGQVSITASQPSVATVTTAAQFDTCSNQTLAAGAACSVIASVIPQQTTSSPLTIQASLPSAGTSIIQSTTTSAVTAMANQTTTHNIVFVNQCPFTVWYEFENNGASAPTADPTPINGTYQLNSPDANGVPSPYTLPVAAYTNGAVYARTGCNTSTGVCATGSCAPDPANPMRCAVGAHPSNAVQLTKLEMFMPAVAGADGVYDVSMVNGFNVPAEFRSLAPANSSNLFGCGQSAGALIQPATGSGLGNCSWTFSPPNTGEPDITANYVSATGVAPAGSSCTESSNSCTCGVGYYAGTNTVNRNCSAFLGYWNVFAYSGFVSQWQQPFDLYTAFNLGTTLPTQPSPGYGNSGTPPHGPATYTDMWGCVPTSTNALGSGYSSTYLVCGCYDWNQPGSSVPTAQSSNCQADNSDWEAAVYPRIEWIKKACPTAYSWNHDDTSSSFTCPGGVSGSEFTQYQITFCPGGQTGLPAGAIEGRNVAP